MKSRRLPAAATRIKRLTVADRPLVIYIGRKTTGIVATVYRPMVIYVGNRLAA